ncbi:UNVERIFIED_CONTAM: hypothetical protein Sangu_0600500 [Sesamum angustifolium]|uniref:Uncharacterized protein n=1 Tax=Sesamum angustifolium TaxID=2727405 RepID=A0AAW2QB11_9LAMI
MWVHDKVLIEHDPTNAQRWNLWDNVCDVKTVVGPLPLVSYQTLDTFRKVLKHLRMLGRYHTNRKCKINRYTIPNYQCCDFLHDGCLVLLPFMLIYLSGYVKELLGKLSVEHEVLEREVGRLRALYQQQQQPQQQTSSGHRRANSRDLDQQFANLSLKPKEATAGRDSVPGQLHM